MKNEKKNGKSGLVIFIAIFGLALLLPVGILSYTQYFAWDSQIEGNAYKIAFEKDGRLFEFGNTGNGLAFDSGTGNDHLYTNTPYFLGDLIALGFQDYDIAKTDNPFFAGKINPRNTKKYFEQKTEYINPKDSIQTYYFYDQNRDQILFFKPETENEFVVKLRPTFPNFSKSRYGIYNKQNYLNATKILREKLDKNLEIKIDETNKLLILSFGN